MRFPALAALLLAGAGACASRAQPYRFASPMLGAADVPVVALPGAGPDAGRPAPGRLERGRAVAGRSSRGRGWQSDAQAGAIRTVSARGIEAKMPVASADVAASITRDGAARAIVWSQLPAPHRASGLSGRTLREPSDLRTLVGVRDKREPFAVVSGWLADLDLPIGGSDGPTLVAWAESAGKLRPAGDIAQPGDVLVFSNVLGDDPFDLIALVIGRDARGVVELVYAGGGVIRRGFLDPQRPSIRRDMDGAVVNTFLRHTKRWPPRGTRYLTGELLVHVIRTR